MNAKNDRARVLVFGLGLVAWLGMAAMWGACANDAVSQRETVPAAPESEGPDASTGSPPSANATGYGAYSDRAAPQERRIIYTGQVEIVVDSFDEAKLGLERLLVVHGAYAARSDLSGSPGTSRTGRWEIRVPVSEGDNFNRLREAVGRLGELERSKLDSQDVTEQYIDLEGRIRNKRLEEARLQRHLEVSTGSLKDILDVEKELSRVRAELEQMQGQFIRLGNQITLATLVVLVHERTPFTPTATPSFSARARRSLSSSVEWMIVFGANSLLVAVALLPWVLAAGAVSVPVGLLLRRFRRRAHKRLGGEAERGT